MIQSNSIATKSLQRNFLNREIFEENIFCIEDFNLLNSKKRVTEIGEKARIDAT